ncbi:MAG: aldolase/citrate lyase family protein [Rhodospirillales bacterium]|nr:aldolase/citrate lyase family protein [Rhodospirillales bacterium]
MYVTNRLRERLERGETSVGCWIHMCSPIGAEVVALAGFDVIIIDHEHGPSDFLNTISLMQAVSATDTTPVMRVPWNDHVYMKRALDIGARGIIIPSVDNAEQARAAVAACRYPPEGIRGSAYGLVRASDYGMAVEQFEAELPGNVLIMCQIESVTAVENVEEIAAVEGVDVLFIGPVDLSASMGIMGQTDHQDLIEMRARAEKAIKAAGKWMGGLAVKGDSVQAMKERGYDIVTGVSDVSLLRDGALAHLKSLGK